jgi:hypothetical protein
MTQRKRNERSALVKQSEQAHDEAVFERPTSKADVIVKLEAGVSRSRFWVKLFGQAPAESPLGQAFATLPLCMILVCPPFVLAAAGFLFVKIPLVTAGLTVIGFGGGAWFASRLTRKRHTVPDHPVIKGQVLPPAAPRVVVTSPQPDSEADTTAP